MSLDNPLLKHLNVYLKILKELSNLLDTDSLQQNTYQCIRQESYAKVFSDLKNLDIDALLITGQAESLSKKVFLNILKQIEVINKLIEDKEELITHFDFIHLYDKILLPKMFDDKILIARQDLKEAQEKEKPIWVSQYEFDEDKKYWEKELYKVLAERETYTRDNVHLIKNYYYKIRDYLLTVKEGTSFFNSYSLKILSIVVDSSCIAVLISEELCFSLLVHPLRTFSFTSSHLEASMR